MQNRIEETFTDKYSHLLLDDVGFVRFHAMEENNPRKNYGIIETHNGDVLFFTSALKKFGYSPRGKLQLRDLPAPRQLEPLTPVTFRQRQRPDGRLRAPLVVPWEPEVFDGLAPDPEYRFAEASCGAGGITEEQGRRSFKTLWKGSDLERLRERYPKAQFPTREGRVTDRYFEKFDLETKTWTNVEDPR